MRLRVASAALQAFVGAQAGDVAALAVSAAVAPVEAALVPFSVAPAVLAEPVAADALLAEPRAALTVRGLVEVEPAAVVPPCVVEAPAASAPAAVASDALALAVLDFAGAARAEIESAVAQPHAVAAETELFVVWQIPFVPAAAVAGPDETVGLLVGLLPGR